MVDVKVVCLTGISSNYMTEKLNEISPDDYRFTAIQIEDVEKVQDSTDVFVLGAPYTKNILDEVKAKAGDSKVINLSRYEYTLNNVEDIINTIEETL